jgi:hypothetical protein
MAHFAVDSGLTKFQAARRESAAGGMPKLARVAHRTVRLVACPHVELLPLSEIGTRVAGRIDDFPEVHPTLLPHIVLNREDVDFGVRKTRRVSLLPLRSDRVSTG